MLPVAALQEPLLAKPLLRSLRRRRLAGTWWNDGVVFQIYAESYCVWLVVVLMLDSKDSYICFGEEATTKQ